LNAFSVKNDMFGFHTSSPPGSYHVIFFKDAKRNKKERTNKQLQTFQY